MSAATAASMRDMTDDKSMPCPICRKPTVDGFRPFCSKRCADVDLNRWFTGAYVVPGRVEEDEDGSKQEPKDEDAP